MTIFAVDDQATPLEALSDAIRRARPEAELYSFADAEDALHAAEDSPCDVAFIDVQMPGMSGIELAQRLKLAHPAVNIIFATAYSDYMDSALAMHASGYLVKPIDAEDVQRELDDLRHPVAPVRKRVHFRTFGNVEVYIDGEPVAFERAKTKEYLAYLVDRGGLCSNAEVAAALWPEEVSGSYFRTIRKDLFDTFWQAGCAEVLIRRRNMQGIRIEAVSCDYYDWKAGLPQAINAYQGEYMSQYSWAELTHGALE